MAYYLLEYSYVPDILERRGEFRDAHLAGLRDAYARGEVVLAGAVADPVDRAVIVWSVEGPSVIETFVGADPYVANGLVTTWTIRPWSVAVGG